MDDDIPFPTTIRSRIRELKPNGSLFFPGGNAASLQATAWHVSRDLGWNGCITRTRVENGVRGVRVWRKA
jgi:hypothetical protein